jgi:iron complex outermembrane receptor protein
VNVFDPIPELPEPAAAAGPQAHSAIEQQELGVGWQREWRNGAALNLGARRVALEESAESADGIRDGRQSVAALYNASVVIPTSQRTTAFASFVRGIEEAGVAPQHAANAFEVLPPALARQSELGMKWQPDAGTAVIATLFEIVKPEPGFDREDRYRFMSDVRHRGVELSLSAEPTPGLRALLGATWMKARLEGEAVDEGSIGDRPVGRSERLLLASLDYRLPTAPDWSFDLDATYAGPRVADGLNRTQTPGYTLMNAGMRYRFTLGNRPAAVRLRVYNASDKYAWYADGGGMQAYEPGRRVMLSLTLGD